MWGPIFDPVERATGYSKRRQAERRQRLAATRSRIRAAADQGVDMFGEGFDEHAVDIMPQADQDFLGQTFYVNTGNELEQNRVIQLQRNSSGGFSWKDLLNDEGEWNAPYLTQWGGPGSGDGGFLDGIRGIAVRDTTGDVYVSSDNRVQKFTPNGTYTSTIATYGTGNGEVDTPWGMAVSRASSRNLYVVDAGNGRIQSFTNSDTWSAATAATYVGEQARDIAFGNVSWGTLAGTDEIVLSMYGDIDRFGLPGAGPLEFDTPAGIAAEQIRLDLDHLWVVDSGNHRVQAISVVDAQFGGHVVSHRFHIGHFGAAKGQFNTPDGIAIDALGNIYVTDSGNHRVQVFDSEGIFRGQFGKFGDGEGEFNTPTGVAITDAYIYVCDSGNHRVQIFANPVAPVLGEVITVSKAATTGLTNTSTATYVTAVEIDEYTDFGTTPDALVLPAGTWEFVAEYSQTYFPTTVATWGIWGRFNGTDGATTAQMLANTGGARASMLALHTGEYVSDGASTFSIRFEFIRHSSWAATPSTEPGFMTVTFRRVA